MNPSHESWLEKIRTGTITSLQAANSKKRVKIFVDGSFSLAIDREVAARAGLQVGQHLSADELRELGQASLFQNCFDAVLHYLSYRPRSEAEVRQRLHRHGFAPDVVDKSIMELKERRLIDDVAFARFWKDNRLSFSPRSRRLIKLELRQKGVATETADEVTEDLNDEISAYEAGAKKARILAALDYGEFRRRLSGHLRRRGFTYEVIGRVVARLWQEQQTASV